MLESFRMFRELIRPPLPPPGLGMYVKKGERGMWMVNGRLEWHDEGDWIPLAPVVPANDNYPATDWREADPDDVEELEEAA